MRIGVIGGGSILDLVSEAIMKHPDIECYALASKTPGLAEKKAALYGFEKTYTDYEQLVQDPKVDLVYVGTPHVFHYEHTKLALENGKPVLCEKPFMINQKQARKIRELAKEKNLLVAEAMWPRYQPGRKMIQEMLDSGIIGDIHMMSTNLSYPISAVPRIVDPKLGGGALLDVGVYGVNMVLTYCGKDITKLEASSIKSEAGVDVYDNLTFFYGDDRMATVQCSYTVRSDRQVSFHGTKGYILVDNVNNPRKMAAYDTSDRLLLEKHVPDQINGYEYEFLECFDCIRKGLISAPSMPIDESVFMMGIMDRFRACIGYSFPEDEA